MVTIPERLVDAVGEPEHHDVLDRLFAEVVIDAIDLRLGEDAEDHAVEVLRGCEVCAERFLDDDAPPGSVLLMDKAGLPEPDDDRREGVRRSDAHTSELQSLMRIPLAVF